MHPFRFQLISLLAGALIAAILLGANLVPRIAACQDPTSEVPGFAGPAQVAAMPDIPETQLHSRLVHVLQGWPLTVREEHAVVRLVTPVPREANPLEYSAALSRWSWSTNSTVNSRCAALNGAVLLAAALAALALCEWQLRRVKRAQTARRPSVKLATRLNVEMLEAQTDPH